MKDLSKLHAEWTTDTIKARDKAGKPIKGDKQGFIEGDTTTEEEYEFFKRAGLVK